MDFEIIIGKEVLLERLRANKTRYQETRKTLVTIYVKKAEEYQRAFAEYSQKIADGELDEESERPYQPSIPPDRTDEYVTYIKMVESHCGTQLTINEKTFKQLYMDKWDFIKTHINALTLWADGFQADQALAAYDTA